MSDYTLMHGDCLDLLPTIAAGSVDAVITDPPFLTSATCVPIRGNGGVAGVTQESVSVGMPWGYSLDWIAAAAALRPKHWIVFCNYRMLAGVCSALEHIAILSAVFVWRKSNAPNMIRPIPRMDCEFIVWARDKRANCGTMGKFKSMVIDVPMPQAGCFATERILMHGSGKAMHPTQKPIKVVQPFVERLGVEMILDPFMGLGTTGAACANTGRRFVGIERDDAYFAIAQDRIATAYAPLRALEASR